MNKILITGGSGLVGKHLTTKLLAQGHQVVWLSRSPQKPHNVQSFYWNWQEGEIDEAAFKGVSHIIHLAGANIFAKRWTKSYKKLILDSRVQSTQLLFEYVDKMNLELEAFICSSAVGYYGNFTSKRTLTENSPLGNDFLAEICSKWENAALQFSKNLNIRTVCLRTGVVLAPNEGAFPKMVKPITSGFGANLGSGKQYMPWIHIDDLGEIYIRALQDSSFYGSYNATANEKITNKEITELIAKRFKKRILFPPVPSIILRLFLGKRSTLLLEGSFVTPLRLKQETNFYFRFESFLKALENLI